MLTTALDTIQTGEVQGSVNNETPTQLPNIPCVMVKLRALLSNTGNVYIGGSSVTVPDGDADATTGIELSAGDESGWIPISNLSKLYRVTDNPGDDIVYLAVR